MGLVVYVTIGDLSRMPGFAAAGDVEYEAVGKYEEEDTAGKLWKGKGPWKIPHRQQRTVLNDHNPADCRRTINGKAELVMFMI